MGGKIPLNANDKGRKKCEVIKMLVCGIVAPLWYASGNAIFIPHVFEWSFVYECEVALCDKNWEIL
jgi:hypothetical protein